MPFENIAITHEGPTAIVTLNRPSRRNALSLGLMLELTACLEEIGAGRDIRAVILAAAGGVFCCGTRSGRNDRPGHPRVPAHLRRVHRADG